jgi:hypothetical protein
VRAAPSRIDPPKRTTYYSPTRIPMAALTSLFACALLAAAVRPGLTQRARASTGCTCASTARPSITTTLPFDDFGRICRSSNWIATMGRVCFGRATGVEVVRCAGIATMGRVCFGRATGGEVVRSLPRVALGEQCESHIPEATLADLRSARVRAWRRWLCLGGWGAFHRACARLARAKRSRLLAAQREGMQRWAARADGRCWHILTSSEVEERFELLHEGLRSLLATKQILSAGEWKGLGIHHLRLGHYVRVGQGSTEMFYGPGEVASQHTLSGEAAEDVGDVIVLEVAPRWDA